MPAGDSRWWSSIRAPCGPYDFPCSSAGFLRPARRKGSGPALRGIGFCHVTEVAKAHVSALTRGRPGEGYICAGVNATYRELCERSRPSSAERRRDGTCRDGCSLLRAFLSLYQGSRAGRPT
jgi:nucleoside-diphosphate-sugar epimerase